MSSGADIRDIDVLGELKNAFGRFGEEISQVLPALQKELGRIEEWLDERQRHWERQIEAAHDSLYEARRDLRRCERSGEGDESPDCSFEENQVWEAERHLTECTNSLETVKQWRHRIESQIADFQKDIHRLTNLASERVDSAKAFLTTKTAILENYTDTGFKTVEGLHTSIENSKIPLSIERNLKSVLNEYNIAPVECLAKLREQARSVLQIPENERNKLKISFVTDDEEIRNIGQSGAEIVERFVSPDLVAKTAVYIGANQISRSSHRKGTILLSPHADHSEAAHEIIHAVEQQNPEVLLAAAKFLLMRGRGEKPIQLSQLTGQSYRPGEKAFEDKWRERNGFVYAGKVYLKSDTNIDNPTEPDQLRATEVLTMGFQRLIEDPLEFYDNDPEWFRFIVNTLRKP